MKCLSGRTRGTCIPECPYYGTCHCGCTEPTRISVYNQPGRGIHIGHYALQVSGHRVNKTPTGCQTRNGIPRERVQPLLRFLTTEYGSLAAAAVGVGTSLGTLNAILYEKGRKNVSPDVAALIVSSVLAIRSRRNPDAPHTPRPPTPIEAKLVEREREAAERRHHRALARARGTA